MKPILLAVPLLLSYTAAEIHRVPLEKELLVSHPQLQRWAKAKQF